jgi:hypothetical protein
MSNLHENIIWLRPNGHKQTILKLDQNIDTNSYFLANLDVLGFYRINYDAENWNKIINQLLNYHQVIPERIRGQLINDVFRLLYFINCINFFHLDLNFIY